MVRTSVMSFAVSACSLSSSFVTLRLERSYLLAEKASQIRFILDSIAADL